MVGVGTKIQLRDFVQHELEDTYLLTKACALGGTPEVSEARLCPSPEPNQALRDLLEHVIMRKQQQVDFLSLAMEP